MSSLDMPCVMSMIVSRPDMWRDGAHHVSSQWLGRCHGGSVALPSCMVWQFDLAVP